MSALLMAIPGIALLLLLGYLSACAGAGRWLSPWHWFVGTTCSHTEGFEFVRNIYGDEIIEWDYNRSIWKCRHCGGLQAQPELQQEEQSAQ